MYRVLLVDDDTINRVAIAGMIEWETLGFQIVGVASDGKRALEIYESHEIDVLITDMKMPIMDGLELIENVRAKDDKICIIALSSYSDFDLVRRAFKSEIEDYILKSELTPENLQEYILKIKEKLDNQSEQSTETLFMKRAKLNTNHTGTEGHYYIAIQVCDYEYIHKRFEGENQKISLRIKEVLGQISKINEKCSIIDCRRSITVFCYTTKKLSENVVYGVCKQIRQVVKNFLNMDVQIGVSEWSAMKFDEDSYLVEQSIQRLTLSYIFGSHYIFIKNKMETFDLDIVINHQEEYQGVINSLRTFNNELLFIEQTKLLNDKVFEDVEQLKLKCLELIYYEGLMLLEIGDSIWNVWRERINFFEKVQRLSGNSSVVMWIANYNRWVLDYMRNKYENETQTGDMNMAKHYIEDNYVDPNLSLSVVASVAGLNEKYFSSKFKKEMGSTFIEYLTNVRMEAAKNLLRKTNMKLAEISEAVGYNNVEHFVRVFKKRTGKSPREYEKRK